MMQNAIDTAAQHFQSGRLKEAESICRTILSGDANQPDALYLLGVTLCQSDRPAEAIDCFRRALVSRPTNGSLHCNLGGALHMVGQLDEAIQEYIRAAELRPDISESWFNLGIALGLKKRWDESVAAFRRAISLQPNNAETWFNLASSLRDSGKPDEAIEAFQKAGALRPDYPEAFTCIGALLQNKGRLNEAIEMYRHVLKVRPSYGSGAYNLGVALRKQGEFDEAIPAYQQELRLNPQSWDSYNNLGGMYKDIGELDRAIACYDQGLAIDPKHGAIHSNKLYTLYFHPDYDSKRLYQEHVQWNQRHAKPLASEIPTHRNDPSPDRQLRIGYVSADLRRHPVGMAIEPLLRNHDRSRFRIYCFSNAPWEDAFSKQLKETVDEWHPVYEMTDSAIAQKIWDCKIDILVDLSLHLGNNRLLVFARKPAPVQVTYLGYPGTTGLTTIDYRLGDPFMDLPGTEQWFSEKTVKLPRTYLCWKWNGPDEEVSALPANSNGYVTFGSLNNFCKVTPQVLETWGRLLSRVKNSRLLLRCPPGQTVQRIWETMAKHGISSDRVEPMGVLPAGKYVQLLSRQDIGLDPFPYPGHTTSLDSLWMGVPIVTLSGETAVSRAGDSLMNNLNLPELIAHDRDEYIDIAAQLAADLPRLSELRKGLRDRMKKSPLTDAPQFARDVEATYRQMWRKWCKSHP